uniref:Uncharacterized protein n=1 Tax=Anopheles atroparvus TaxID=41427 RepID=A0AAG5DXF8_ANOAO
MESPEAPVPKQGICLLTFTTSSRLHRTRCGCRCSCVSVCVCVLFCNYTFSSIYINKSLSLFIHFVHFHTFILPSFVLRCRKYALGLATSILDRSICPCRTGGELSSRLFRQRFLFNAF